MGGIARQQLGSQFAVDYGHTLKELDINPIKVMQKGCVGLDMLLVNKV